MVLWPRFEPGINGSKGLNTCQINFLFWIIWIFLVALATILVKNLPEDKLKELKRLKVELGCRTWAELLVKLVDLQKQVILEKGEMVEMRGGVEGFLKLRGVVSSRWKGEPSVLDESRKSKRHETT